MFQRIVWGGDVVFCSLRRASSGFVRVASVGVVNSSVVGSGGCWLSSGGWALCVGGSAVVPRVDLEVVERNW